MRPGQTTTPPSETTKNDALPARLRGPAAAAKLQGFGVWDYIMTTLECVYYFGVLELAFELITLEFWGGGEASGPMT